MNIQDSALRKVYLYGELADRCGDVWELAIKSVGEAIRAIDFNTKKMCTTLLELERKQIKFNVMVGGRTYTSDEILAGAPVGANEDVHICPVLGGAEDAFGIILGVVLVAASFIVPGSGAGIAAILGGTAGFASIVFYAGVSLILGGLAQLITSQGNISFGNTSQTGEQSQSYFFNGPANIARQGAPVPLGYGELIVGSVVVNQSLRNVPVWDYVGEEEAGAAASLVLNDPDNTTGFAVNSDAKGWGVFDGQTYYGGYEAYDRRTFVDVRKINQTIGYPVDQFEPQ